jgi:hypothetical protein
MNVENAFNLYFELDNRRKALDKKYKEDKQKIEDGKQKVKDWLGAQMATMGTDQFKCSGLGIVFPEVKQSITVTSADAFRDFIVDQIKLGNEDAINLVNASANEKNCRNWLEEEEQLPEGVDLLQERVITIRRSK